MRIFTCFLAVSIALSGCDLPEAPIQPSKPSGPVTFSKAPESRFVAANEQVTVAVLASSANKLPIKYVWKQISGPAINHEEELGGTQFLITPPANADSE